MPQTIQWWPDSSGQARILWVPGGSPADPYRIAWDESCCCLPPRECAGCAAGTVPGCLRLVMLRYVNTPPIGGAIVDCSEAAGDFIVEYADPQPPSMFWSEEPLAPNGFIGGPRPCIYRYYFGGPTNQLMYGWGVELFKMSQSDATIIAYALDGDDRPWRFHETLRKNGEEWWTWPGVFNPPLAGPLACHDFTAADAGAVHWVINTLAPAPDCRHDDFQQMLVTTNLPVGTSCPVM